MRRPLSQMLSDDVDPRALEEGWQRVRRRRGRARVLPLAFAAGLAAATALVLVVLGWQGRATSPVEPPLVATPAAAPTMWSGATTLEDGSRVEADVGASLRARAVDARRVELALDRGVATFDVRPGRSWSIDAGLAVVRVLGTRFTVDASDARVIVSVERGRVLVESEHLAAARVLSAGERIEVTRPSASPPAASGSHAALATPVHRAPAPKDSAAVPPPEPRAPAMALADAARREGRRADAARILSEIVERRSPEAALAAFTLGKIDADEQGNAARAATWFERSIALGLPAGLDEEAHARAVECHARAGQKALAARAAQRYEARHPAGRHLSRVREWTAD